MYIRKNTRLNIIVGILAFVVMCAATNHLRAAELPNRVITNVVDGSGWKTQIRLVNLSATTAFVHLKCYGDDSKEKAFNGFSGSDIQQIIPANGSVVLETAGTVDSFMGPG